MAAAALGAAAGAGADCDLDLPPLRGVTGAFAAAAALGVLDLAGVPVEEAAAAAAAAFESILAASSLRHCPIG